MEGVYRRDMEGGTRKTLWNIDYGVILNTVKKKKRSPLCPTKSLICLDFVLVGIIFIANHQYNKECPGAIIFENCDYCHRNASQHPESYFTARGFQCLIVSFSRFTRQIPLKIGEYFFHITENRNRTRTIFLQFVLWHYQVIIMICKHGTVSSSQLYSQ